MEHALEFLTYFNWLSLPQFVIETFWNADWKSAYRRAGNWGLCVECLSSLFALNTCPFFIPSRSSWSGRSVEQLLASHGIRAWGWAYFHGEMFFHVRKQQAAWAQYVMLRAGVPLQGPLLAQAPDASAVTKPTAKHSPQHSTTSPHDLTFDLEQQLGGLIQKVSSFLDL